MEIDSDTLRALLAEAMAPITKKLEEVEKQNKELQVEVANVRHGEAAIPAIVNPTTDSYWGSRAARSVVLPTRPVTEDPNNPTWFGKVANIGPAQKKEI